MSCCLFRILSENLQRGRFRILTVPDLIAGQNDHERNRWMKYA